MIVFLYERSINKQIQNVKDKKVIIVYLSQLKPVI